MAELAPVPAPRSPLDGWRGWVVGIVVVGVLVAVAKPWGSETRQTPLPSVAAVATPAAIDRSAQGVGPASQAFDPAVLGDLAPGPAWTLVTSHARTALPVLERATVTGGPGPSAEGVDEGIVAGPVIDLGTTDDLGALAIAHPRDVSLAAVRLWRFATDGSAPRRVELDPVASPWPVGHVQVLAHRDPAMAADRVLAWDAGLYRLDLLIAPVGHVRSVMLTVRQGATAGGTVADGDAAAVADHAPFQRSTLRLLPAAANLWALGGYLSGWHRDEAHPGCAVAEIWQATDPRDGCWPVPLGRTDAIGVNPPTEAVTSIGLRLVDPLPGPAGSISQIAVDGRVGLAFVRAPDGGLADGIYRLDVGTSAGSSLTWYLEVGPIGRAVAAYYEASTSR